MNAHFPFFFGLMVLTSECEADTNGKNEIKDDYFDSVHSFFAASSSATE